jgi:uncharacterized protein YjiS (DUF1127 family)
MWLRALGHMVERWQQRQTLIELDDHIVRDVGISREQAVREAQKPFWR